MWKNALPYSDMLRTKAMALATEQSNPGMGPHILPPPKPIEEIFLPVRNIYIYI